MSSTRFTRHIAAPRTRVYRALIDANDVQEWMVPDGMSSRVHAFHPHVGGAFRISLTYDAPTSTGKSSAQTDTFHGRFVELVADTRVVQSTEFETADPGMQGEMRISYELRDAADGGTELTAVHDNLPSGLSAADNEKGWSMSLGKLAALCEAAR
jgi:uncharacterized protein YndB with AHSA1/START domain